MNKAFFDICYNILSHHLHFPDIADTFKSIGDGIYHRNNFPNDYDYKREEERNEIIKYIRNARIDNIIYSCLNKIPLAVPGAPSKSLENMNLYELHGELEGAIAILILKGIHQLIKLLHQNSDNLNDDTLSCQLLQQDINTLQMYGLYNYYGGM